MSQEKMECYTLNALSKNKFSIISLEFDSILVEGILDNFNYESPFENIDNEIIFIEYIILIEKNIILKQKSQKLSKVMSQKMYIIQARL